MTAESGTDKVLLDSIKWLVRNVVYICSFINLANLASNCSRETGEVK